MDLSTDAAQYEAAVEAFKAFGSVILDLRFPNSSLGHNGVASSRVSDADREQAFLRFSYVLAKSGRELEAINMLQDAVMKHPTYYRVAYNLVVLYNQQQLYRTGESWLVKVVRAESYHSYETRGVHVQKLARPLGRRVVAIYCYEYGQAWWGQWGPSSVRTGLGGSEEAVVFLAAELHKLGYWVEVYGDPPLEDQSTHNVDSVAWYPHSAYDPDDTAVDVFIAWRYHASLVVGQHAQTRFVWLHDIPSPEVRASGLLTHDVLNGGILCVSAYQALLLPRHVHESGRVIVTSNGLSPAYIVDGPNHATKFVYGAAPSRGLERVLRAWPQIRAAIPNATLTVYYGFTPAFDAWASATRSDYASWKRTIETLLHSLPGVHYTGLVGHSELASGYADAGFYLYPTTFSETSAVSLMKAMAAGAVPITSRYVRSALNETCGAFDVGPDQPLDDDMEDADAWLDQWVASVIQAVNDPKTHAVRAEMKAFARATFSWAAVAQQWHRVLSDVE